MAAPATAAAALQKPISNNTFPFPSASTVKLAAQQPPASATGKPWVFGLTVPVTDVFELGKKLGEGGHFGFCKLATERKTGKVHAVKHILKQRFNAHQFEQFRREVAIMERVSHDSVVRLHSAYEDDVYLYIAMEYCAGGELFDKIVKAPYSERDAAALLRQIFEALAYLHRQGVAHCDLKPDNFLFTDAAATTIKVIDFGLSKFTKRRVYFNKYCGTSFYVAPEVCLTEPHFNEACDMWSMGVVTFVMLFGYPPFHDDSDAVIIQLILQGFDPTVREGYGAHFPAAMPVTGSARDFISRLLQLDVAKRMTAEEALAHPWLKGTSAATTTLEAHVFASLRGFLSRPRMKAAVLRLMTDQLSDYEVTGLKNTFHALDTNHDGTISVAELAAAMQAIAAKHPNSSAPITSAELDRIFKAADLDGSGTLSYEELMLSFVHKKLTANEERLWMAFRKLDADRSGTITADEIYKAYHSVNPKTSKDEMKKMLGEVDANNDGAVDYEEFLAFMWEKEAPPALTVATTTAAAANKQDAKTAAAPAAAGAKLVRQDSAPHPILQGMPMGAAAATAKSAPAATAGTAKPTTAAAAAPAAKK